METAESEDKDVSAVGVYKIVWPEDIFRPDWPCATPHTGYNNAA